MSCPITLARRPDDSDSDGEEPMKYDWEWKCVVADANMIASEEQTESVMWQAFRMEVQLREKAASDKLLKQNHIQMERRKAHQELNRKQLEEYNARILKEATCAYAVKENENLRQRILLLQRQEQEQREGQVLDDENRTNVELEPWLYNEIRKLGLRGLCGTFQSY